MRSRLFVLMVLGALASLLFATAAVAEDAQVVGSKACKACHSKQYASWEASAMGKAMESLKANAKADQKKAAGLDPAKDYTTDATCLGCHTTGFGKPGGYSEKDAKPELAGVGCEDCHGAGSLYKAEMKNKEYKKADVTAKGLKEAKDSCASCHNDKSPFKKALDVEKGIKEGTHEHIALKNKH